MKDQIRTMIGGGLSPSSYLIVFDPSCNQQLMAEHLDHSLDRSHDFLSFSCALRIFNPYL